MKIELYLSLSLPESEALPGFSPGFRWASLSNLISWIDSCKGDVGSFFLFGGEPLLYPDLKGLVKYLDSLGRDLYVFTGGAFGDSHLETLESLQNLRGLIFSIHGSTAHSHFKFTGGHGFDLLWINMKRGVERGIPVYAHTVTGEHNMGEIKSIIKRSLAAGVRRHFFGRYTGPVREGISLYRKELLATVKLLGELAHRGLPISLSPCFPLCFWDNCAGCPAGRFSATLCDNGQIRPCARTAFSFGALESSSLGELWESQAARAWRSFTPSICAPCDMRGGSCHCGCPCFHFDYLLRFDPLILEKK